MEYLKTFESWKSEIDTIDKEISQHQSEINRLRQVKKDIKFDIVDDMKKILNFNTVSFPYEFKIPEGLLSDKTLNRISVMKPQKPQKNNPLGITVFVLSKYDVSHYNGRSIRSLSVGDVSNLYNYVKDNLENIEIGTEANKFDLL